MGAWVLGRHCRRQAGGPVQRRGVPGAQGGESPEGVWAAAESWAMAAVAAPFPPRRSPCGRDSRLRKRLPGALGSGRCARGPRSAGAGRGEVFCHRLWLRRKAAEAVGGELRWRDVGGGGRK